MAFEKKHNTTWLITLTIFSALITALIAHFGVSARTAFLVVFTISVTVLLTLHKLHRPILQVSIYRWLGLFSFVYGFGLGCAVLGIYEVSWPGTLTFAAFAATITGLVSFAALQSRFSSHDAIFWSKPALWLLRLAPLLAVCLILTRLLFSYSVNLLSQEAYYWKYAENLDFGYLDHPPAVALLIWLGTALFGHTEFGVRIGCLVCWLSMAYFVFKLTKEWFDENVARIAVLLVAVLPFFSGIGFFMTPDAPLVVWWVGSLYFLHKALLQQKTAAWYAVGVCLGLGMLSKYPIVLIGPAILVFLIVDSHSRRWFLRKEPYLAAILALLCFFPVLWWNKTHEWASFMFQGPRRMQHQAEFYTPRLLIDFLILLTPAGLLASILILLPRSVHAKLNKFPVWEFNTRVKRFSAVFTLTPLAIFTYFSFSQEFKINWTAPIFLALIPLLAYSILFTSARSEESTCTINLCRTWLVTILLLVLLPGMAGTFLSVGFPGVPYTPKMHKLLGWDDLTAQVIKQENILKQTTHKDPLVVGGDSHYVGSELGFYRAKAAYLAGQPNPLPTQGRALFGLYSLMYYFWTEPEAARGRDLIIVSKTESDLNDPAIISRVERLDPIQEIVTHKLGSVVGRYFMRVAYNYQPNGQEKAGTRPEDSPEP